MNKNWKEDKDANENKENTPPQTKFSKAISIEYSSDKKSKKKSTKKTIIYTTNNYYFNNQNNMPDEAGKSSEVQLAQTNMMNSPNKIRYNQISVNNEEFNNMVEIPLGEDNKRSDNMMSNKVHRSDKVLIFNPNPCPTFNASNQITEHCNTELPIVPTYKKNSTKSTSNVCRICYEADTEEKGSLIYPCLCTGSCKFIHESCLKKWIENHCPAFQTINNTNANKIKAECEICKMEYIMKFFTKYRFSNKNTSKSLKSMAAMILIASIILTLVFTVIYVVVSSLSPMNGLSKSNFINILVGIACGLLLILVLVSFRNCRKNFYEPYLDGWKIYNVEKVVGDDGLVKVEVLDEDSNHEHQNVIIAPSNQEIPVPLNVN